MYFSSKPSQTSEAQPGVADAYLHAFDTLRSMPLVNTPEDNLRLTDVLQRLVDEHGDAQHSHRPYNMTCTLLAMQAGNVLGESECMHQAGQVPVGEQPHAVVDLTTPYSLQ